MTERPSPKPKFEINIEGRIYPWNDDTITVPQIRKLGNLPADTPVVEVDLHAGTSRQLAEDEVVHLRPGMGFGKKVEFKRGGLTERMTDELALLHSRYPEAEFLEDGQWIRVPGFKAPADLWSVQEYDVCFPLKPGYPDVSPYGMYVSPRARTKDGSIPQSYSDEATPPPPFAGEWGKFSVEIADWKASSDVIQGGNLLDYVEAFRKRLAEGV